MNVAPSYWSSLRWLAASRVAIALVLFAFFPLHDTGQLSGGLGDPALYGGAALLYLLAAVLFLSTLDRFRAHFHALVFAQALTDIVSLSTLMYAAGGLKSGLLVLLIVALAGSAIVATRRMAAFFAAAATLFVLGQEAWHMRGGAGGDAASLMLAGLVGIGCFAAAMTVNWLATRLHAQERIAQMRADDLRRQLAVTSRVVAELAHGVMIVDAAGAVRAMNPAARALLGIATQAPATLAQAGEGSGAGRGWAALRDAHARWRGSGGAKGAESDLELAGADGRATRVRLRFLGAVATGEDTIVMIEDQRLVEDRAQQLKLASMGRLSASIAHEIRNPLGAIRHANGLLAERIADPSLERLTRIVESNTVRIDRIVEDVLSIARRERSADESIEPRPFLDRLVDEFVSTSGAERARIGVRLATAQPIRFDSNHLRQVLLNLLANALRYASTSADAVRIEWRERGDRRLELRVADDGPGLTDEMREHAFEPFYTTESRGTGLGLYLARELCHASGATIRYETGSPSQRWRSVFVVEPRNEAFAPE
ncbi:MAG: ATP-binding protein [Burkholderiaceae bacterium]|nr:ATP-binding protein [Burkholderiaceae bacterium]